MEAKIADIGIGVAKYKPGSGVQLLIPEYIENGVYLPAKSLLLGIKELTDLLVFCAEFVGVGVYPPTSEKTLPPEPIAPNPTTPTPAQSGFTFAEPGDTPATDKQIGMIAQEWDRVFDTESIARDHMTLFHPGKKSRKELTLAEASSLIETLLLMDATAAYKTAHGPATPATLKEIGIEWGRAYGDVAKDVAARESAQCHFRATTGKEKRQELTEGEAQKYLTTLRKVQPIPAIDTSKAPF